MIGAWAPLAFVVVARFTTSAAAAAEAAHAKEQEAFVAVDEQRWCEAMELFLEANAEAATADLVYNAARAAELGGDRQRAVLLYTEVLGAGEAARRAEARKQIAALSRAISADGPGSSCEGRGERDDLLGMLQQLQAARAPVRTSGPAPAAARAPSAGASADAPALRPATGIALLAMGAMAGIGAAASFGLAAWPGLDYAAARDDARRMQASGSPDPDALDGAHARQAAAEHRWRTLGPAAIGAGAVLAGIGAVLGGAGALLLSDIGAAE